MNNAEKWICPNCDTHNEGRRCVVCGQEKIIADFSVRPGELKSTMVKGTEKQDNKMKVWIIVLSCIIAVLVLVICILLFVLPLNKDNSDTEKETKPTETVIDEKDEIEEETEEEIRIDPLRGVKFDFTVDVKDIDTDPDCDEKEYENISYAVPENFKSMGENRYIAKDKSAYIYYEYTLKDEETSISDILDEKHESYGDNLTYEDSGDDWYVVSAEEDDFTYYECIKFYENEVASFVLVYPSKYEDGYTEYIDLLFEGMNFLETNEVVIID